MPGQCHDLIRPAYYYQMQFNNKHKLSTELLPLSNSRGQLSVGNSQFDLFQNKDLKYNSIVRFHHKTLRLKESKPTRKTTTYHNHLSGEEIIKGSHHRVIFETNNLTTLTDNSYRNENNYGNRTTSYSNRFLVAFSVMSIFGFKDKFDDDNDKELTPLDILIRKGAYCLMKQDYAKAEEILHDALVLAQDDDNYEKEMLINNILATSYFENEDLVHAEKIFVELIKNMLNHNTDPTDPAILELSLKLASIYSRRKDSHHKAVKGYQFVIDTLQEKLKDLIPHLDTVKSDDLSDEKKNELALLGWGYDWLAKHYIGENNMEEATKVLKKAVQISSVVLGRIHDQTLILMNDVGTTLAMSDSPEEGCDYIKKAVEGAKEAGSQELASFYANLGLIHLQLMKIDQAIYYCEQSTKLASSNRQHYNFKDVIATSRYCLDEIKKLSKSNK